MKTINFLELAKRVINEEQRPLSTDEIWDIALQKGYDVEVNSKSKTPSSSIGSLIYVNMRDHADSPFYIVGTRPKHFYLKTLDPVVSKPNADTPEKQPIQSFIPIYLEIELHPFLTYFAENEFRAYTKTIRHNLSSKKEFAEWIHPDIIGCNFQLDKWKPEVLELISAVGATSLRFYSFELKRELNFSNLRESFFQTVSNSSWANEAYLVAAKISGDNDFQNELRRLSISFGIGIISLNLSDPDLTEILFPSTRKEVLDWEMVNKLTDLNPEFKEFLKRVTNDMKSKEIRKEWYDKVLTHEELISKLKV